MWSHLLWGWNWHRCWCTGIYNITPTSLQCFRPIKLLPANSFSTGLAQQFSKQSPCLIPANAFSMLLAQWSIKNATLIGSSPWANIQWCPVTCSRDLQSMAQGPWKKSMIWDCMWSVKPKIFNHLDLYRKILPNRTRTKSWFAYLNLLLPLPALSHADPVTCCSVIENL